MIERRLLLIAVLAAILIPISVHAEADLKKVAFAHEEKTLDMGMKNLKGEHLPANRVHQRWMLEGMKDLILPSEKSDLSVELLSGDYDRVAACLHSSGLINRIPEFTSFYKDCSGNGTK